MKRILIASFNLDIGGIEKSLLNFLKRLSKDQYQITLLLQQKSGVYLNEVPSNIEIKEYRISNNKNSFIRKIKNRFKLIITIIKNYKKYDHSICYATYDIPSTILTRYLGKVSTLWVHSDYKYVYKDSEYISFFKTRKSSKFSNIVFVSNEALDNYQRVYGAKNNLRVINNFIDNIEILKLSNKKINIKKKNTTFVYVGRLEEHSKNITMLLKAFKKALTINPDLNLWIVGDGKDKKIYLKYITDNHLDSKIKMLGMQNNPYPYIKTADALVLTSNYEGFPVVTLEALTLSKPIITTINVSSNRFSLQEYAHIIHNEDDLVKALTNPLKLLKAFDPKRYNHDNYQSIIKLLEEV